ncbi:hypothetical protein R1flu_014416 [Riccia fluitans]|uniref:Uncharacterized protein n=1 Tax=Riccia fluitans TaxID=41844 RepID=A0ABD1YGD7_9MARC
MSSCLLGKVSYRAVLIWARAPMCFDADRLIINSTKVTSQLHEGTYASPFSRSFFSAAAFFLFDWFPEETLSRSVRNLNQLILEWRSFWFELVVPFNKGAEATVTGSGISLYTEREQLLEAGSDLRRHATMILRAFPTRDSS